ncbi:hypothetical protein N2597_11265 [Rhizobium sophoriradicis]|uniref:hypothetical protein n=1 Tax=Rhizobium sophoriradicis TaxID=1535245 RepID=UPI00160C1DEC|nr:hypothetical protein N2597_11265 [Rhizobium leguminosarum bv. phaseoli]
MNDDLFTGSLIVVLAFAAYPLFLCIWHVIGAYTDKFAPSQWELDPEKQISLGRMKIPVLSVLMIVGIGAFSVVLGQTLLMLGLHPR